MAARATARGNLHHCKNVLRTGPKICSVPTSGQPLPLRKGHRTRLNWLGGPSHDETYTLSSTQGPTQRQLRVGEQLRHVIVQTLQRGHFHNEFLLSHCSEVTVSEVRVSPDMKHATAYAIRLGGGEMKEFLAALMKTPMSSRKKSAAKSV